MQLLVCDRDACEAGVKDDGAAKGKVKHWGDVVSVTEMCGTDDRPQLIAEVQIKHNRANYAEMLVDNVDGLAEQTNVVTMYSDGEHNSAAADEKLAGLVIYERLGGWGCALAVLPWI